MCSRILYTILVKLVTVGTKDGLGTLWAPCFLRNFITNFLLHYGGIHSGCGVSSLIWLVYSSVLPCAKALSLHSLGEDLLAMSYCLLVTLSCLSAIPALRFQFPQCLFEHTHRYPRLVFFGSHVAFHCASVWWSNI